MLNMKIMVSVKIDTHKHFTLSRLIFTHMLQNMYCSMCMWNYYFMTLKLLRASLLFVMFLIQIGEKNRVGRSAK